MDSECVQSGPPGLPGACGTDLTTGSVVRHLIRFSVPMLMGSAFHTAYSLVNAFWVNSGLGANAMAAITGTFPIFFFLMAIAGGLTLATNVLVSQSYGAQDWARLKRVIQNSVVLTAAASVICAAAGFFAAEPLLRSMNTPPDVIPLAVAYLRIFVITIPFMFGLFLLTAIMRGVGDSKTPLYFQAGALLLTVVLDPLLIFGWLGFPKMGLNGTALANLISQAGGLLALAVYLHRRQHVASPDWLRLRTDAPTAFLTLKIGVPSMAQQALVSLGMLFIVGMVNTFGAHSAAAFGLAMRIDQLAFMPAMAIGMAISSLAGQNIGAHEYDRVRRFFRWGVTLSLSMTLVASLLSLTIPAHLMGLFGKNDADVIATGAHYLRIVAVSYLMFAVLFASNGVINGAGHTLTTTTFTLIVFWVVRVPLAKYLSGRLGDVEGVWYAIVISTAVGMTLSLAYYFSGLWMRPVKGTPRTCPIPQPADTLE